MPKKAILQMEELEKAYTSKLEKTDDSHICPNCGSKVLQNPGRKEKKYCNSACRIAWWKAHHETIHRKSAYNFECAFCGKSFTAYGNKHRKYCSHECYIKDRFGETAGHSENTHEDQSNCDQQESIQHTTEHKDVPHLNNDSPTLKHVKITPVLARRERIYQMTMSDARKLFAIGAINADQYSEFEAKMLKKYRPVLGRLFSEIDIDEKTASE